MKIRVKKSRETRETLLRNSVPIEVIAQLLGKKFDYLPDGAGFCVPAIFAGKPSKWSLAPECVEIVEK